MINKCLWNWTRSVQTKILWSQQIVYLYQAKKGPLFFKLCISLKVRLLPDIYTLLENIQQLKSANKLHGHLKGYNLKTVKFYKLGFNKLYKAFILKSLLFKHTGTSLLPPHFHETHMKIKHLIQKKRKVELKGGSQRKEEKKTSSQYLLLHSLSGLNLEEKTKRFKSLIINLQKQNNRYISISIYSY